MKMSKQFYAFLAIVSILFFASTAPAQYGMMRGMHGGGGMMRGYGYQQSNNDQRQEPIDQKQAETIVQNYVGATENPNLKAGSVKDKGEVFEAEILTKDDSMVDKIWIDKVTGRINTQSRYGMGSASMRGRNSGTSWNFCPYCGNDINPGRYQHMGRGMMREYGMHHGMGYGYFDSTEYKRPKAPESKKDVEQMMDQYLSSIGNPNLKLGEIKESDTAFVAEIVTRKKADLVNKIEIDKRTGVMRSSY